MYKLVDHLYIFLTILLTVYGQIVIKWQVGQAGQLPDLWADRGLFVLKLLFNPWVMSGLVGAFIAAMSWIIALSRFEMSYAYPFVSLTFPTIVLLGALMFGEDLSAAKIIGVTLILAGVFVHARG